MAMSNITSGQRKGMKKKVKLAPDTEVFNQSFSSTLQILDRKYVGNNL